MARKTQGWTNEIFYGTVSRTYTPLPILLRLMLLRAYYTLQASNEANVRKNSEVRKLHESPGDVNKGVGIGNEQFCKRSR